MHNIGMKGIYSTLIGATVIALLLFSSISAISAQQSDTAMLRLQASREITETTENLVRLLDKSTAFVFINSGNINAPSCNPGATITQGQMQAGYDTTIANYQNNARNSVACKAIDLVVSQGGTGGPRNLSATGRVRCNLIIGDWNSTEVRAFSFNKEAKAVGTPPTSCIVYDTASKCQEQPTFNPACNN